jgi:hypothetical protein
MRLLKTKSTHWVSESGGVFQAFPYHRLVFIDDAEREEVFSGKFAVALRYSAEVSGASEANSYHILFDQPKYGMEDLGHRTRKNVKRGLRSCSVDVLTLETLIAEGWEVRADTLRRQGRNSHHTRETWRNRYRQALDLPGFRAWSARVDGKLAAFLVTFQMDRCCYILDQFCKREYLALNVNNALTFTVTEQQVASGDFSTIFYGMQSLDAPESVSDFKFHMGYRARPVRQSIVFNPHFAPLVNRVSYAAVRGLARLMTGNRTLSKAEGMMRFYLSAQMPAPILAGDNVLSRK